MIAVEIKPMTRSEFRTISEYIETNVGIKMPEAKYVMMQSRLAPRLRKLGFTSYRQYIDYVFEEDKKGEELVTMIDCLTTNKTEFFRESDHFDYLSGKVLPEFTRSGRNNLNVWSAACSSGEEPYTLSIVLKEYLASHPDEYFNFSIMATDISTKILEKARDAVYSIETIEKLSYDLKKKYFLKGKGDKADCVRVKADLRSYVNFGRLNFMNPKYEMPAKYFVVFCRNVLIYFSRETQEEVIRKITENMETGGYLFLGHSETIFSMDLPLKGVAPTVYRKI